jgi:hypothetical protein
MESMLNLVGPTLSEGFPHQRTSVRSVLAVEFPIEPTEEILVHVSIVTAGAAASSPLQKRK